MKSIFYLGRPLEIYYFKGFADGAKGPLARPGQYNLKLTNTMPKLLPSGRLNDDY